MKPGDLFGDRSQSLADEICIMLAAFESGVRIKTTNLLEWTGLVESSVSLTEPVGLRLVFVLSSFSGFIRLSG